MISHQPVGILRLEAAGATLVQAWFAGAAVLPRPGHQALAQRLVTGGYGHWATPEVRSTSTPDDANGGLTVVVPVKDDLPGLRSTLTGLLADQHLNLVIVDDGSRVPISPNNIGLEPAHHHAVDMVRLPENQGPAAARNRGLSAVTTPMVAFVDAGVVVSGSQLRQLAALAHHPGVAAAAPRVVSTPVAGAVGDYERQFSPLDMGRHPSVVAPGRVVSYVPTACLVARTSALEAVGGLDHSLRFGEDVDLVWRLANHNMVLYRPDVVVTHPPRRSLGGLVSQRFSYGSSAGPLADRHGDRLTPVTLAPWLCAAVAASALLSPFARVAIVSLAAAVRLRWLSARLQSLDDPVAEAAVLVARELHGQVEGVLSASRRPWSPILAGLALFAPARIRGPIRTLLASAMLRNLASLDTRSLSSMPLAVIDDLGYSAGVLAGSARSGQLRPLLPRFRTRKDQAVDRY